LAIDGLGSGIVFYGHPWSFFPPFAEVFQVLGAVLLFVGLPLFTAGAYLTGKYVYSKLPDERPLLQRGPYRYIRHPIYLSFLLTSVGFLLLAENFVMLPLLFALTAIRYPKPEEEELIRLYGDSYREYRKHTGRFFPKLRRG
jgi:protein-S-isoprenylcysteine O-methyltransferase Ste14